MKTLIIIPAFNEEHVIGDVIYSLKSQNSGWDILVVNDGSFDRTGTIAESTGKALVVNLPENLGIGGAVQTGFMYAFKNDYDLAVQFDGDGQHIASEIPKLLEPIINGSCEVVIGSRFSDSSYDGWKSSTPRRMGIKVFELVNSILIRQRITDNTSGFRAYNKRAISLLSKVYPRDYPEPEAVILLGRYGIKMGEVSVKMQGRSGGTSSISSLRSVYYMFKVLLSIFVTFLRANKFKV